VYVPHQLFERRPFLTSLLGAVALVMSLFFFMLVLREYRGFGKVPQRADLATVIPPPDMHGIWMEVTQPLIVHCEPVETEYPPDQQILFGRVDSTYFLAEIPGSERVAVLEYDKQAACNDVQRAPVTGVLTGLNPKLRETLESHGMVFPRSAVAVLLCLSCGPRKSVTYLFFLGLMMVVSLWLTTRSWRRYQQQNTSRHMISVSDC
jgi:hypothetical protein